MLLMEGNLDSRTVDGAEGRTTEITVTDSLGNSHKVSVSFSKVSSVSPPPAPPAIASTWNATLTPTEVTISATEKLGLPIRDLLTFIGRYGIMDPYTGSNLAHLLPNYVAGAWTLDKQSFSILVYELDPTGTIVKNAQIVSNMMPRTSGEFTMKKDINAGKEVRKYSIGFTGFGIRGLEVIQVAQTYVNEITNSTKDALLTKSLYQGPVDNLSSTVINGTLKATAANL